MIASVLAAMIAFASPAGDAATVAETPIIEIGYKVCGFTPPPRHVKKKVQQCPCCEKKKKKKKYVRKEPEVRIIVKREVIIKEVPIYIPAPAPCQAGCPIAPPRNVCGVGNCPPRIAGAAPGTPGGGYVAGAPRSPAECIARGGTDTGTGCRNYN